MITELGIVQQELNPKIRIFSHEGIINGTNDYIEIGGRHNPDNAYFLQSYQFSESVANFSGNFSFTVYEDVSNKQKKENVSLFGKLRNLDVVEIYENSEKAEKVTINKSDKSEIRETVETEKPVFVGVIHNRKTQSMLSNGQAKRITTISGTGVYSLIGDFSVSLDVHTLTGIDASIKQTVFTDSIKNEKSMKKIVAKLWNAYIEVNNKVANAQIRGTNHITIEKLLNKVAGSLTDLIEINDKLETFYPVAASFFSQSVNRFSDMLRTLFPQNVYEMFGRIENGKPKLIIRENPFSPADWRKLNYSVIKAQYLTGYSVTQSDSEVYTAFLPYIEGSSEDQSLYTTLSSLEGNFELSDKVGRYGYRPLIVNFRGYDRSKVNDEKTKQNTKQSMANCLQKLKEWYGDLDDFYNATFNLVRGAGIQLPKIGEKIRFCGYEFYVKEKSHSWNYGGAVNVVLNCTRGSFYSEDGVRGIRSNHIPFGLRYAEFYTEDILRTGEFKYDN